MDKKLAGLAGAVGALIAGSAQASTAVPVNAHAALQASSYSDLLKPIPNALAILKAQADRPLPAPASDRADRADTRTVQYHDHHHHHHHHPQQRHSHHHGGLY